MPQEPPECPRVSLHAIGSADNKDCIVEHLQRALHLRREIHMSRRIQNCYTNRRFAMQIFIRHLQPKPRLLGKNCYSTRPLLRIRIQKCILMIHTPQRTDLPGGI